MKACPKCVLVLLETHPELLWWKKCPTCGYCELSVEHLPEEKRELALKNPYVKHPHLSLKKD